MATDSAPLTRMLYTVEEAGQVLGISQGKAWELVKRGELPVLRIPPRSTRVAHVDLEAYVERLREAAQATA